MDIEGKLNAAVELALANITGNSNATFSTENSQIFDKTNIKIYGNLKRPLMALTMSDLITELPKLIQNPNDYLASAPMFYSALPLSSFLDRKIGVFTEELDKQQLNRIFQIRKNYEDEMKIVNTLIWFSNDISGANNNSFPDLLDVNANLTAIKNNYESFFNDLQKEWLEILARKNFQILF